MALGKEGSSFNAELNRLAGTTGKADQGAANAYASTSGKGILGALNIKASASRQPNDYKGLNAICNELAGTTGKSALAALRSINLSPIEFVSGRLGSNLTAGVTNVTFTGHAVGDLLIATGASRTNTAPTFTAGWTTITSWGNTISANSRTAVMVYKFATSTDNETLTFTSAAATVAFPYSAGHTFRNVTGIGNFSTHTSATASSATYNFTPLTLSATDSSSAIYGGTFIPVTISTTVSDAIINNGHIYALNKNGTVTGAGSVTTAANPNSGLVELLN